MKYPFSSKEFLEFGNSMRNIIHILAGQFAFTPFIFLVITNFWNILFKIQITDSIYWNILVIRPVQTTICWFSAFITVMESKILWLVYVNDFGEVCSQCFKNISRTSSLKRLRLVYKNEMNTNLAKCGIFNAKFQFLPTKLCQVKTSANISAS